MIFPLSPVSGAWRLHVLPVFSMLNRGQPVAHLIFGIPFTINSANYAYFIALKKTLALNHPKVG